MPVFTPEEQERLRIVARIISMGAMRLFSQMENNSV